MRLFEQRAIVGGDAANHVRIDANAVIGKHGERRGVLEEIQIGGAQRDRQIRRQRAGDAEAAGHVNHVVHADFFGELHRGNVARAGQRAAQRDDALEFFVVVVRRIGLAAAHGGERRVENRVERSEPLLHGRGIHVNLERTADLALRLRGAVEFRFVEAVAADHGLDFAGGIVDRHHGRLRADVLLELHARDAAVDFLDIDLDEIAGLQEISGGLVAGPGKIGWVSMAW